MSTLTDLWNNLIKSFGSNPIPFNNTITSTTPETTDNSTNVATTAYVQNNLSSYSPSKLIQTGTCPDNGDSTNIQWQIIDEIMTLTWYEANIYDGKVITFGKSFGSTELSIFSTFLTTSSPYTSWIQNPVFTTSSVTISVRNSNSNSTTSNNSGWSANITVVGKGPTMVSAIDPNISINDSTTVDSLSTAVLNVASPVGIPHPWPTDSAPDGWLLLDGSQFNTSQYPLLAKVHPSGVLPDLRGLFIRGYDPEGTYDIDGTTRGLLSTQHGSTLLGSSTGSIVGFQEIGSGNQTLDDLNWDNPYPYSSSNIPWHGYVGSGGNNAALISELGTARPSNISYNYIVRAA